ncbi:hypothetical protein PMAYCL1PPCAC_20563, partial [Pristionchus mayeri]
FAYTTAKDLGNKDLWGYVSTYGDGGFVQYLSTTNKNTSIADIAFLKANRWTDRGTRLVVIDFSVYNGNLNLFCVINLIFELPPVGGLIPMSEFTTLRLLRYVSKFDYVV